MLAVHCRVEVQPAVVRVNVTLGHWRLLLSFEGQKQPAAGGSLPRRLAHPLVLCLLRLLQHIETPPCCSAATQADVALSVCRWRFAATPERVYSQGNAEVLPAGTAEDFGTVLTQKGYQVHDSCTWRCLADPVPIVAAASVLFTERTLQKG